VTEHARGSGTFVRIGIVRRNAPNSNTLGSATLQRPPRRPEFNHSSLLTGLNRETLGGIFVRESGIETKVSGYGLTLTRTDELRSGTCKAREAEELEEWLDTNQLVE
jgi:hypothetical protein